MKKRLVMALLVGGIVGGAAFALAANLNVSSATLGEGGSSVAACTEDNVNVAYAVHWNDNPANGPDQTYTVFAVDVNAPDDCAFMSVRVELTDGGSGVGEAVGATNASGDATLTVTPEPAAANVDDVHVVITG